MDAAITVRLRAGGAQAMRVTVANMQQVATWSDGAIKGTKLNVEDRVIAVTFFGDEQTAEVGDWIVKWRANAHQVFHHSEMGEIFAWGR